MSELRNRYIRTLEIPRGDPANGQEKALGRAYQLRTFEIEHYWKRATYFWGFQVAIFAAFGFLWNEGAPSGWNPITLALSGLGVLTAFANSLSARGSKFWQQNWESHIDMLEDDIEGRLHKTVWLGHGKVSFSVSRINQALSDCFVGFWVIIAAYVVWKSLGAPALGSISPPWTWVFGLAFIIVICVCVLWLFRQTTDFHGTLPKENGAHGTVIKRFSRWCKRITSADSQTFLRRYAPGEVGQDEIKIRDLIQRLTVFVQPENRANFVLFGSAALVLHGIDLERAIGDLDVFVSEETFASLRVCFEEKTKSGKDNELVPFYCPDPGAKIEILKSFPDVSFDEVSRNAQCSDASEGFSVGSVEDLKKWKEAQGRPKDKKDLEKIEEFLRAQSPIKAKSI